jgi:hypothetical protein
MNDELKKAVRKSQAAAQPAHPKERAQFKSLLLGNPNYFGNLSKSAYSSMLGIANNTHYEELVCLGYQPQQEQLEAVVYIYQPSGYGTDVCGPGTPEYVRFYLSFDNGASWHDQGITSFQAYDIPAGTEGGKRLEYAATLKVDPARKGCSSEQLILARAILSWNNPPPPNQPNWHPVWGNVRTKTIQVAPRLKFLVADLLEFAQVKVPLQALEGIGLDSEIAVSPKALTASDLVKKYQGNGIPLHRFAFKELKAFTDGKLALSAESLTSLLPGVAIEAGSLELLAPKADGDTSYEELTCIGYDPNAPNTLVGVIHVKKASGYSGGLCTTGSQEHVTFWADFDGDGSFETCLGTASVTVHDLTHMPSDGVHYAVRLPVDFSQYRRPCGEGARVVPVRAILSWSVAVPCTNANQVPTWGNREETLISIPPVVQAPAGRIAILGGIPTSMIDGTGHTTTDAVFATNNMPPDSLGRPCPFAGRVSVQGAPLVGYTYVVEVSPDGVIWSPVLTPLVVVDQLGNVATHNANPITKRFDYLPFTSNVNGLLAQWDTAGNLKWSVRLSVFDGGGVFQGSDTHALQLHNSAPEASIDISTGPGNCGKFPVGTMLSGTFVARDPDLYLGSYSLSVEPVLMPPGAVHPTPSSGTTNTAVAPGDPWTLDTNGMQSCGYIVRVVAVDRAIINSQAVGHHVPDSAGFCLVAPTTP